MIVMHDFYIVDINEGYEVEEKIKWVEFLSK